MQSYLSFFWPAGLAVALLGVLPTRAHEHLAAGAVTPDPEAALLFVNAAVFAAESGYTVRLDRNDDGAFDGQHHGEISFVSLAATLDYGGPVPFHPALGARIETVVESAEGPAGGAFGFWETTGDTGLPIQLTFHIPVGETNGTHRFPVSENNGSPGSDPYGHIHGRVFSATLPGLYRIGFRFVDTSANGANGQSWHTPSPRFHLNFQAGVTLAAVHPVEEGFEVTFATTSGFTYLVESATRLDEPSAWVPVAGPEPGTDRLQTVLIPATADTTRFFRLRREVE